MSQATAIYLYDAFGRHVFFPVGFCRWVEIEDHCCTCNGFWSMIFCGKCDCNKNYASRGRFRQVHKCCCSETDVVVRVADATIEKRCCQCAVITLKIEDRPDDDVKLKCLGNATAVYKAFTAT